MQRYLIPDVVNCILKYLNKDDSFNLVNTAKFLSRSKATLYGNYLFDHSKIKNDRINQYIKHIKNIHSDKPQDRYIISDFKTKCRFYRKLEGVYDAYEFNEIEDLDIHFAKFIRKININIDNGEVSDLNKLNLSNFINLKQLGMNGVYFDYPLI